MSWGERSCEVPCRRPNSRTIANCNVDCPQYIWDGNTKPDSVSSVVDAKKLNRELGKIRLMFDMMNGGPK